MKPIAFFIIFLLVFSMFSISCSNETGNSGYTIGLDSDEEDFDDYIANARKYAKLGEISAAENALNEAIKLGIDKDQVKETEELISRKKSEERERLANATAKRQRTYSSSSSSPTTTTNNERGQISVRVETGGVFLSVEVAKYSVKIRKTENLGGGYDYGTTDEQTGSGGFWGSAATFHYKSYGYYDIEYSGYDKSSKKIFHVKYSNIKHACSLTSVTVYANGNLPSVYCP